MNNEIEYQDTPTPNREYKDRLFRAVFKEKRYLLDLYNAVNNTNYQDPEALQVNTLENIIYLSMKNDISFLISGTMNLYEHQSSYNPNMPIRGLMYFGKLYDKYITQNNINIFSSSLKKLPVPQYFIFYNGTKDEPDQTPLRLSDAFFPASIEKPPCLECTATMLNINYGHNKALLEKCRRLEEYSLFVTTVRGHLKQGLELKTAVSTAVDECINRNILEDILTEQKSEVIQMVLETFNKEAYEKDIREEGREEGILIGHTEERENSIRILLNTYLEFHLSRENAKDKLMEKYALSGENAEEYLQKYWTV